MATRSKAFGSKGPRASHLVKPGGGLKGEVWDFRNDVEESFSSLEGRVAADSYPELDYINGTGPSAAGADMELVGRDLVQGQVAAELDIDATHGLIFTALVPGEGGNDLTIELISGGATGVVKTGNAIAITWNAGVDDDDAIATAVNADGADTDGVLYAVSSGTVNAAGINAAGAVAATALAGGVGEGWSCTVGGNDCLPANTTGATGAAALTETSCTVTVPALTPIVATDLAKVYIDTDGVRAELGAVPVQV